MNKICVRYLVSGRVQGVFFRASTRYQAQSLGISGYARNRADGRVEVLACGESKSLDQFKAWLVKGPDGANVTGVAYEPAAEQTFQGFSIT